MIFPRLGSELASKQIRRTGRVEAVTKEGLAATLLPGRQPDRVEERHPLRRDQDRLRQAQDARSLACISTRIWSVPLYLQYRPHFKAWYPCFYRQARAEYSQANGLYVLARQVTDAPLDLVAHGPASLTIHGVVFPCRARSAGDGPAGGSAPVDAPARSAPELVHPRQNVPRPFGRVPDRLPPRRPVAGVPSW